jgi:hypothetical protein
MLYCLYVLYLRLLYWVLYTESPTFLLTSLPLLVLS